MEALEQFRLDQSRRKAMSLEQLKREEQRIITFEIRKRKREEAAQRRLNKLADKYLRKIEWAIANNASLPSLEELRSVAYQQINKLEKNARLELIDRWLLTLASEAGKIKRQALVKVQKI